MRISGKKNSKHPGSYPLTVNPQPLTELLLSMVRFFVTTTGDGWENSQKFRKGLFLNLPEFQLSSNTVSNCKKITKKTPKTKKTDTSQQLSSGRFFLGGKEGPRWPSPSPLLLRNHPQILHQSHRLRRRHHQRSAKIRVGVFWKKTNFKVLQQQESLDDQPEKVDY